VTRPTADGTSTYQSCALQEGPATVVWQQLDNKPLSPANKYVLNACAKSFGDNCKLAIKDRDAGTVVQAIDFSNDCGEQCTNCDVCRGQYITLNFYYDGSFGQTVQFKSGPNYYTTTVNAVLSGPGEFQVDVPFQAGLTSWGLWAKWGYNWAYGTDASIRVDCMGGVKIGYKIDWNNNALDNTVTLISAASATAAGATPVRLCDARVCNCPTCVPSCSKAKIHAIKFRYQPSSGLTANSITFTAKNSAGTTVGNAWSFTSVANKGVIYVQNIPQSIATFVIVVVTGSETKTYTVTVGCGTIQAGMVLPQSDSRFFVEEVSTNRPLTVSLKVNRNDAMYGSNVVMTVWAGNFPAPTTPTGVQCSDSCNTPCQVPFSDEYDGIAVWIRKASGGTDDYKQIYLDCSHSGATQLWSKECSKYAPVTVSGLDCGKRNLCDQRYPCSRPCNTRPRHGGKGLKGSTGEGHRSSGPSKGKWNPWNQDPSTDEKDKNKKPSVELETFGYGYGSKRKGRQYKNSSGMKSSGNTGSKKGSWGSKHPSCDPIPVYDMPRQCCEGQWKCKSALLDFRVNPAHRYYFLALSRDCNCQFDDICVTEQPDSAVNVTEWANGIWKGYGTPKSSYKQSSGLKGTKGGRGSYIHKAEGSAKVDQPASSSSSSFGASIPSTALVAIGVAVLGTVLLAGVVAVVIRSVRRRRQLQAEVATAIADAAAA